MPDDDIVQIALFLVRALVDDPDAARINESPGSATTLLTIQVGPGQAGQVIGKHGRNIEAIRTFLQACGAKANRRVVVEFEDGSPDPYASRPGPPSQDREFPAQGEQAKGWTSAPRGSGTRFRRRD